MAEQVLQGYKIVVLPVWLYWSLFVTIFIFAVSGVAKIWQDWLAYKAKRALLSDLEIERDYPSTE